MKSADKTDLNAAIEEAKKLVKDDYTSESWTAFADALAAAEAVAADDTAPESEVAQAVADLAKAKAELVLAEETPAPTEKPDATEKPEATEKPDATQKPDATHKPEATTAPNATEKPSENPTTGSNSPLFYGVLAVLSGLGLAGVIYTEKKKSRVR